jgi:hypothetical protein
MSSTRNPGRFAGLLYVLVSIVGFFAMGYVPGKLIVHANAGVTPATSRLPRRSFALASRANSSARRVLSSWPWLCTTC